MLAKFASSSLQSAAVASACGGWLACFGSASFCSSSWLDIISITSLLQNATVLIRERLSSDSSVLTFCCGGAVLALVVSAGREALTVAGFVSGDSVCALSGELVFSDSGCALSASAAAFAAGSVSSVCCCALSELAGSVVLGDVFVVGWSLSAELAKPVFTDSGCALSASAAEPEPGAELAFAAGSVSSVCCCALSELAGSVVLGDVFVVGWSLSAELAKPVFTDSGCAGAELAFAAGSVSGVCCCALSKMVFAGSAVIGGAFVFVGWSLSGKPVFSDSSGPG